MYKRYPDQFTAALSKIGGLIALLKIASLALKEYHRKRFENQFFYPSKNRNFSIQGSDDLIDANSTPVEFKEMFNFKNLL